MSCIASALTSPGASAPRTIADTSPKTDRIRISIPLLWCAFASHLTSSPSTALRDAVLHLRERLVEDRHGQVDVLTAHRQWRRDPPYGAPLRAPADVHAE